MMTMDKWDACAFPVSEDDLEGRIYYGGLDLSSTTDITAFVLVFPPQDEEDKYSVLPYFWVPEDTLDLRVTGRYGELEKLGDKLMKSENFEMALDEIVWLITLLCNQTILVYNLKNPNEKKPELTTEEVELLTSPMELTDYKDAIMEAMYRGTKRNIESEPEGKNTAAG